MNRQGCARRYLLYLTLSMLAFTGWAFAQSPTGSIEGIATDVSGAVVVGANVTATNSANGAVFNTSTNEVGLFRFPVVPVGAYKVAVEKGGFGKIERNVVVSVGAKINLPITLGIEAKSTAVTVTGEAPVIETTRTQVSSAVNERSIHELPVNGRNFIDFVLLTPGVTRDVRTGDLSFAGQRGTLNSLTVDGADNNNTFFGQTTGRTGSGRAPYQFSQDSVQEFQVNSNAYSAELGRAGGAVINVVTKSGTNQFHGTGFWFYRDQSMNAYDPITKLQNALKTPPAVNGPKAKYHFNQLGGTIGGPIVKDKMFFFFNYDGQRNAQPNTVVYVVPAKPGNLTTQQSGDWDTAVAYLNNRSASYNKGLNQDTYMAKYDWNISQRHQLSARWNRQSFVGLNYENATSGNALEHTGNSEVHSDTFTSSLTSSLTNSTVNVFRFTYLIDREPGLANSDLPEAVVKQGQTILTVGRNSFSPRETTIHRQQYGDTLTYVRGRHTLKFGGDAVVDKILNYFPGNFSGAFTFNTLADFGASLSKRATSGVTYAQAFAGAGTSGATTHPDMLQASWFVQDDWRVRNNLTVNLGLRYDVQSVKQPAVQNPAALAAGFDTSNFNIDKNNFAPRIGFAWTPLANGKWVWRAGYGMFYGNTPSIMYGTAMSNNGINVGTLNFNGLLAPTYPNTMCGAPVDKPNCAAPTGGAAGAPSIYVLAKEYKQPLVQQGNLGTEYALTPDLSVSVNYLWVKGTHLQRTRDVNFDPTTGKTLSVTFNDGTPAGTVVQYQRKFTSFARISQFESTASSVYNGLSFEVKKRFSHNFQGTLGYTWGHVIDDAPDATAVVPFSSGDDAKMVSNPLNMAFDRASGSNDQRQRLVLSGVWQLNYGQKLPRVARAVVGGWELSGILSAQSGQPYTGAVNSDLNNDSNNRTDRAPGVGRNSFNLPATWSLDPRVTKNFNITERAKLQAFVEAFNVFNRFNVLGVRNQQYVASNVTTGGVLSGYSLAVQSQTAVPATYFGMPSSASPRILQLGAKITF